MEVEHRVTLADGRTLACLEVGMRAGTPFFYMHGFPGSRLEARLVARAAEERHMRVIALDRPGIGQSTFQHNRAMVEWGADVQQVADHFELQRFPIVGMSGGAPYALACAWHMPERVTRVALIGGLAPTVRNDLKEGMVMTHRLGLAIGLRMPWLAQRAFDLMGALLRTYPERALAQMSLRVSEVDRAVLSDRWYLERMLESTLEAMRQGGAPVAHELSLIARTWGFRLGDVRTSVAIWHGLADNIVPPAMACYLASELSHSELHCLHGEGHLSLLVRHSKRVFADLILVD